MNEKAIISSRPSKRINNTDSPFSLIFKLRKVFEEYPCEVYIELRRNHQVYVSGIELHTPEITLNRC